MVQRKPPSHAAEIRRLNRIAGQVEGVRNMIEQGRYCPEILAQLRAVRAAVKGVEREILQRHLSSCAVDAMKTGSKAERQKVIAEITALFTKFDE